MLVRNESHEPINLGYDCDGSNVVYRTITNRVAIAVSKGDCEVICHYGEITINNRIVPIAKMDVDSKRGQWEPLEDMTGVYTRLYQ